MARVKSELLRVFCPYFADIFMRRESAEGFETPGEIICSEKIGKVLAQLVMVFIVVALHCCLFERPVHALDLPVGPRVVRFGQPMFDAMTFTGSPERMTA